MTFSFSNSGPVQSVHDYITSTAEQYAGDAVHHVGDMLHKLVDQIATEHGVVVSASGHADTDAASFSVQVSPMRPPEQPAAPTGA